MSDTSKEKDIISALGNVTTEDEAKKVFRQYMDDVHFERISKLKTPEALKKIANAIVVCNPGGYG